MVTLDVQWQTRLDPRVCEHCRRMHGYTWTFTAIPDMLTAQGLDVWDGVQDRSTIHDSVGIPYPCRCSLTFGDVDVSTLTVRVQALKRRVLAQLGQMEVWSGVGQVRVVRHHGRFVTWERT